jgi:hypothetical protein
VESLELRLAPAIMLGVTASNELVRFDSDAPDTFINSRPITGLVDGDSIDGIDLRPATGEIMGLGSGDRLYSIDPLTGVASLRGVFPFDLQPGFTFGFDVNPVTDELRITGDFDQNFRVKLSEESLASGTSSQLTYAAGDPNCCFNQDAGARRIRTTSKAQRPRRSTASISIRMRCSGRVELMCHRDFRRRIAGRW